ncbi:hypothetical protein [Nocardioides pacificus]
MGEPVLAPTPAGFGAALVAVIADQAGVIARRQVLEAGGHDHDIARRLRRREWAPLLPGVYVDHTGAPTWLQRAWAGVLFHSPAALAGVSALRAAAGPGWRHHDEQAPIHLAVTEERRLVVADGYRLTRYRHLDDRVLWNTGPPRVRVEEAALDVAGAAATELEAIAGLADLCQSRWTTPVRLRIALEGRRRLRRRRWLDSVLRDLADGTCSVLEHSYLHRVERAHGLPRGSRQVRSTQPGGQGVVRDVEYDAWGLIVELDGRLFHDLARQRDRDLERDLAAALTGRATVRLGWGQVHDRSCATAGRIAALLQSRGWPGSGRPCGPGCPVGAATPR